VRVALRPAVIDLLQHSSVSVTGVAAARSVRVRLEGATDAAGLAYVWTPYPWRHLHRVGGTWRGVLPAPALRGIYRVQIRIVDSGSTFVQSPNWLLRVFHPGTMARTAFTTPQAVLRDLVHHLPGGQVLVARKRWPQARFDRRDPRLNRIYAIAYAPRGNTRSSARLGLFVTTVRDGYTGRWRLLDATVNPYG
jgi:hypothetical protein